MQADSVVLLELIELIDARVEKGQLERTTARRLVENMQILISSEGLMNDSFLLVSPLTSSLTSMQGLISMHPQ